MKKILEIESINLLFKSVELQKIIINNYGELLNSLQIPIEIYCKSKSYNMSDYNIHYDLQNFIKNKLNNIVEKKIYIIVSAKNETILDSNLKIIQKYLKNININCKEINILENYNISYFNYSYVKGDLYYRTYYIKNWPNNCENGWLEFLYNSNLNIDINNFIIPQNTEKSIRLLKKKLLDYGVNYSMEVENSFDDDIYINEINSIKFMLDELRSNKGKLFLCSYYITVKGNTLKELNQNSLILKNILISKNIKINQCLLFQQKAINNFEIDKVNKYYNFTTNVLKTFFPFQINNICDKTGIYIGKNIRNNNLIFLDIFLRGYAVILILGLMNSGKSFLAKNLIRNLADVGIEITILDKSGEYSIFKNDNNIKVYSKRDYFEYLNITKEYIKRVNKDYLSGKCVPRLFVVDELWSYINENKYANKFNEMFNEIILEGRKKYLGICVISQLIEPLIKSNVGISILKTANIKFLMKMELNESKIVSQQYNLNEEQKNFLANANHEGLLMINSNCIQFKVDTIKEREEIFNTNPQGVINEM